MPEIVSAMKELYGLREVPEGEKSGASTLQVLTEKESNFGEHSRLDRMGVGGVLKWLAELGLNAESSILMAIVKKLRGTVTPIFE